jgi:hemerythrin superfamily protein
MSLVEQIIARIAPDKDDGALDAIELLKRDHDDVDKLFADYDELVEKGSSPEDRRLMSTRICGMLAVHAMIEEEIFYPSARKAKVDADLLDEAEIEHGSMKELIAHIGEASADERLYDARVKVLGEYVRHHVREEESELFPKCRAAEMDLDALGTRLRKRRDALMQVLQSTPADLG